jgi:hypothetical protein
MSLFSGLSSQHPRLLRIELDQSRRNHLNAICPRFTMSESHFKVTLKVLSALESVALRVALNHFG